MTALAVRDSKSLLLKVFPFTGELTRLLFSLDKVECYYRLTSIEEETEVKILVIFPNERDAEVILGIVNEWDHPADTSWKRSVFFSYAIDQWVACSSFRS